jgi:hypothetical protein
VFEPKKKKLIIYGPLINTSDLNRSRANVASD